MSAVIIVRRNEMNCFDDNFKPVMAHDIFAPTVKVTNIHEGVHTYTCLLCHATETRDVEAEMLLLTDDIAFGGGSPSE